MYCRYSLSAFFRVDIPVKQSHIKHLQEPHIKKPLNAFMLYMKEMRPVVQAECTLKESAAINQILGRRVRNKDDFLIPPPPCELRIVTVQGAAGEV